MGGYYFDHSIWLVILNVPFLSSVCLFTGQFWNIPLKIEPYVGQYGERLVDLMDRFYSVTVSYPNAPERTFVAKYDERDWFDNRPCLYAGDADGGCVSEAPTSDSVIEGQLAAMLCRISSALTLSSPSTTEIVDEDGFRVVFLITFQC